METSSFAPGTKVWCRAGPNDWSAATVLALEAGKVRARRDEGTEQLLDVGDVELSNSQTVEDMTALSFLNEPGVLWNLQSRYAADEIYTYTGNILIAVNPFRRLPHLYGTEVVEAYRAAARGSSSSGTSALRREVLPPHVYATACAAYQGMMRDRTGQAILVTGESGAGKTETAKLIMACLTYLGSHQGGRSSSGGSDGGGGGMTGVEQKILESNPLLEAFGNAKTLRNHNSSRFGKYVEIFFDPVCGSVTGAAVRTYLLERSRVVAVNSPERSFHIFYQLVYGASSQERAQWRLPDSAAGFAYLARSSCYELPGQSNAEEYQHTRSAMTHIGLSDEQQAAVLRTVAAVLHLGNITFEHGTTNGHEGAVVSSGPGGGKGATRGSGADALAAAAELLGVEAGALAEAITTKQISTPEGSITVPLPVQAACEARDSLAKVVYAKLFDWLVAAVNAAVDEAHSAVAAGSGRSGSAGSGAGVGAHGGRQQHLSIGLLDIYGFESFEVNDLEQLCINLTNEKLQQHFNTHVFKWEQAEYEREGVDWSYIAFRDNADVLELLEGRMGLMDLLDETCRFPKASADDLIHKYGSSAAITSSSRFARLRRPATAFSIEHYAGNVTYDTKNFLDKNKDYIVAEHQALMGRSSQPLLREVFRPDDAGTAASGAANGPSNGGGGFGGAKSQFQFRSVASLCRKQLGELMAALTQLQPHYVRCIKPNPGCLPGSFDAPYSLQQLRCGGVLEAVRISCAGYAYKRPYSAFLEHFWQLCPEPVHALRRRCEERRRAAPGGQRAGGTGGAGGQQGLGELLASYCEVEELKAMAAQLLASSGLGAPGSSACAAGARGRPQGGSSGGVVAACGSGPPPYHPGKTKLFLRSTAAGALERLRVARLNGAAATIQAHWKRLQVQRWYATMRAAVVVIQTHCRALLARRLVERLRRERAATTIQRGWRSCVERMRFLRARQAASVLQAAWRAKVIRRDIEAIRTERAALVLQTAWRGAVVRREYVGVLRFWRAAVRVQAAWRGYMARQLYHQILPLHRAALTMQRVWRSHRRGSQLAERLRNALLTYWLYTRAAVVIQAAWRGKLARMRCRKMRLQQRRARFLAVFGGGSDSGMVPFRPSPDAARRQDSASRTPSYRTRGMYGQPGPGGKGCAPGTAERGGVTPGGGAGGEDVVRSDVLAHPDRDSRMRARLQDLTDFKVMPLLQYWQQHSAAVGGDLSAPNSARRGSTSGGAHPPAFSSRPGTADGCGPVGTASAPHVSPRAPCLGLGGVGAAGSAMGSPSGGLSCEPSYGQLLDAVQQEEVGLGVDGSVPAAVAVQAS